MSRDRAGWIVAVALTGTLAAAACGRHGNYWSEFDLAVFDQGVWLLARGHGHVSLIDRHIFADHFSPILVFFVPLYRLTASPNWLLGVQAAMVASTVMPMRAFARDVGAPAWLATVLVVCSAPLLAAGFFDFHPSTLAVPFVALSLLGGYRDDRRITLVGAIGVILCRADLAWALMGIAIVAKRRARVLLASAGLAGAAVGVLVPWAIAGDGGFGAHYGHIGAGPADVALHPWRLIPAMFDPDTLLVLGGWLLPVALLPLLRPRWTAAVIVSSLPVLLSQWPGTKLPWHHYGAPYVPIAVAGGLVSFAWLQARGTSVLSPRAVRCLPGLCVAVGLAVASPLSTSAPHSQQLWTTLSQTSPGDPAGAVAAVRPGRSVSAPYYLVSHLGHRRSLYLWPLPFEDLETTLPPGLAPDADASRTTSMEFVVVESGRDRSDLTDFVVVSEPPGYSVLSRRPHG